MTSRHTEDGSIPLTLTVIILVGGVVAALVATVIGTQRTVTFDRNYTEAITGADAALQQALSYLSTQDYSVLPATVESTTVVLDDGSGLDDSLGRSTFEWTADKTILGGWEVRASGQVADVTRVVESSLQADQFFILAAFGELGVTLNGDNFATSYPATGLGAVGSNNLITLKGNTVVDIINFYGTNAGCDGAGCTGTDTAGSDTPFDMDEVRAAVQFEHDESCTDSDYVPRSVSSVGTPNADGSYSVAAGTIICASTFDFDADLVISNADRENPVRLLATGVITADNERYVNCPPTSCNNDDSNDGAGNDPQPNSGALRISTLGNEVRIGNKSEFAAAVLAPNGLCRGNPSAAGTDVYGSLICQSLGSSGGETGSGTSGNQGGWGFYFDTNLIDIGAGSLEIASYREESVATTSFD